MHYRMPTIIQDGDSFTMRGQILKIFHVAKIHGLCLHILAKMVTITRRSKWQYILKEKNYLNIGYLPFYGL